MVFSSIPVYLDPHNWQQQETNPQSSNNQSTVLHLPPFQPPPLHTPLPHQVAGGVCSPGASQIRPNSMAERARLAKVSLPEAPLQCPRCESTNTKFCYFNNYSLSQPRHFCKTCRRYWTRGGALRSVPVGGGCRRNKRSRSSNNRNNSNNNRSKSTVLMSDQQANTRISSSAMALPSHGYINSDQSSLTLRQLPSMGSHLPLLQPLQSLSDHYNQHNMENNFGGIDHHYHHHVRSGVVDQWRSLQQLQQFPFLIGNNGMDQSTGIYQLIDGNGSVDHHHDQLRSKPLMNTNATANTGASGLGSEVKEEENENGVRNMSRNLLENFNSTSGNDQYWGGNGAAWSTHDQFPSGFTLNNSNGRLL